MKPNDNSTTETTTDAPKKLDLATLQHAVDNQAAAFRCRRRLQPAGGPGDKVFPPTFAGAVYAVEQRRVPGHADPVTCVVLDTVQSQANNAEAALQAALDAGTIKIPIIRVSFADHAPEGDGNDEAKLIEQVGQSGIITSLQVPHRLADAILRDSEYEEEKDGTRTKVPFRSSTPGKTLNSASQMNALPVYRYCPTALLFGMWDSTGPKGGLGAKFERAFVSEVVGVDAQVGDLMRGVRRDPVEIRAKVQVKKLENGTFQVVGPDAKGGISPSKVNHSSVPFPEMRDAKGDKNRYSGVTIDHAEQLTTISLIALRRLRFPIADSATQSSANAAAQTVLAALGLCAATLAFQNGMGLRSRCLLWPESAMEWELLKTPGVAPEKFTITSEDAVKLLTEAVTEAAKTGIIWEEEPVNLTPGKELVKLVRLSQLEAIKSDGETSD